MIDQFRQSYASGAWEDFDALLVGRLGEGPGTVDISPEIRVLAPSVELDAHLATFRKHFQALVDEVRPPTQTELLAGIRRLEKEVSADGGNDTVDRLFAGVPALPPHSLHGRSELLGAVLQTLRGDGTRGLAALRGLAGVGKTALATAVAWHAETLDAFPGGVLWVGLGPQGEPGPALNALATALAFDAVFAGGLVEGRAAAATNAPWNLDKICAGSSPVPSRA